MPDWVTPLLDGLTGEFGVIVAEGVMIYFLWRLFREECRDRKSAEDRVDQLAPSVAELLTIAKERRKT